MDRRASSATSVSGPVPGGLGRSASSSSVGTGVTVAGASNNSANQSIFLNALHDPLTNLKTFSGGIRTADIFGTGEYHLLVADTGSRALKVFKGTALYQNFPLMEDPCAVSVFYSDTKKPRIPTVAVAGGSNIYYLRQMRPYWKFTLPMIKVQAQEEDVWSQLQGVEITPEVVDSVYEALVAARSNGVALSSRSLDLLAIPSVEHRILYIRDHAALPLGTQTSVTCMDTIKRDAEDEDAVGMLVVGTEDRQLLFLDHTGTSVVLEITLRSVPVFIVVSGLYDVDYRVSVACRDGRVYTVRSGELISTVLELETQPIGLVRIEKSLVVGTMAKAVHSFHIKGKKNFTTFMTKRISNLALMSMSRVRMLKCLLVALDDGEVRIYNQKNLVASMQCDGPIAGMMFGPYGREENSLIIVSKTGALTIKLLQRNANLEVPATPPGPPPEQDVPLNVPKKTQLYVEQTQREREQAVEMHRSFQRDLCKLRLQTARAYVKIITNHQSPVTQTISTSVRLNVQVQGLGPLFKLKLAVQNNGDAALSNITLVFEYKKEVYHMPRSSIVIPNLVPGLTYDYDQEVRCVEETGGADVVKVYVCTNQSCVPAISAIVNMPISDVTMIE